MDDVNVLVIEGKKQVALEMEQKLTKMGFVVTCVTGSVDHALLEIAGTTTIGKPHAVLIAVDTGTATGSNCIEAAQRIRQLVDVPVIYITPAFYEEAQEQEPGDIIEAPSTVAPQDNGNIKRSPRASIERIRAKEPFAHIIKPSDEWELRYSVENAIYRHRLEKRLSVRLRCERAIADTVLSLLVYIDTDEALHNAIRHLLRASEASRVYIFENFMDPQAGLCMRRVCEVCAPGVDPEIDNPILQNLPYAKMSPLLLQKLQNGETYQGIINDLPGADRLVFEPQGILSIVIFPIQVEGECWGFLGFDNVHAPRRWSEIDLRLLRAGADVIGEYLSRKKLQEKIDKVSNEWHATIDAINDAICLVDIEGNVQHCNKAMVLLVNRPMEKIIGENICSLIDNCSAHPSKCPFKLVKKTQQRETQILQAFNSMYQFTVDPFFDKDGNLAGAVHIMSEVVQPAPAE